MMQPDSTASSAAESTGQDTVVCRRCEQRPRKMRQGIGTKCSWEEVSGARDRQILAFSSTVYPPCWASLPPRKRGGGRGGPPEAVRERWSPGGDRITSLRFPNGTCLGASMARFSRGRTLRTGLSVVSDWA